MTPVFIKLLAQNIILVVPFYIHYKSFELVRIIDWLD